ncbi:hypothetical protein NQ315_004913 [Exocentrus adspersus]|uniref:RCC1-like domain-containing protein n=1 Tax=Exocentrus adspersus TaxID=1586481 RepID=A0AAV8W3A6_9CUCU|nr:hypothetical protein NQ315_004913 [Exocentrus adspersus]
MSTKRKRAPVKKVASKKGKRKEDSDVDSELSDGSESENPTQPDEILIAGHGDALDDPTPLPKELLNTLIKPAGQFVCFGNINWDTAGKKEVKGQKVLPNLHWPHRFTDIRVRLAVSGCVAAHCVLVTEEGNAMTFGRNPFGQLGLDHTVTKNTPQLVPALENMNIIGAACGRHHTLFLTDTGTVYACGDNRSGQCGVGNLQPQILTPTRINYRGPPIVKYCISKKSKDGHVSPVDVTEIVDFSCGQNHTVAIDSKKRAFSWGFGGFGRLGHAEQKDEMVPRLIKYFDSQSRGVRSVHCGSTYSLAVTEHNGLFMFGQTKKTGEANMYPKPVQDLAGWNIKHIGTGNTSIIVAADDSVIAWGASPCYGELGFGDMQKASTVPKEVTKLAGVKVLSLAMGLCFTLLIAQNDTPEQKQKLETLKEYKP